MLNAGVSRAETGAQQALAVRARLRELNLRDPALQVHLFDTLVAGGLLYGAEIWGAGRLTIDKLTGEGVHRGYVRGVLRVRCAGTPAPCLLAELGRFPLYVAAAKMICKFWNRLVTMDADRLLLFIQDLDQARSGVKGCWSHRVSSFLNSIGLRTDLLVPARIDIDHVVTNLKVAYIADANSATGTKLAGYLNRVEPLSLSSYTTASSLSSVRSARARRHLAQFRTGSHWLQVEAGRFGRGCLPREQRLCTRCSLSVVDDESHMLFWCPAFDGLRLQFTDLCWVPEDVCRFLKQHDCRVALFLSSCARLCSRGAWVKDHALWTLCPLFGWPARLLSQPSGPVLLVGVSAGFPDLNYILIRLTIFA